MKNQIITVEAAIKAPVEKVWQRFTDPTHIVQWNFANDDWHAPHASNDLRTGGSFLCRMEAKDGSFGFDFGGVYDQVRTNEYLCYTMDDGRKVEVVFVPENGGTTLVEKFEAESENPIELQQMGWQAILDNFRKYAES